MSLVTDKLEEYFEKTGLDYLNDNQLADIFDNEYMEISDEDGWRCVTDLWVDNNSFVANTVDRYGGDHEEIVYLTRDEEEKLLRWLNNELKNF